MLRCLITRLRWALRDAWERARDVRGLRRMLKRGRIDATASPLARYAMLVLEEFGRSGDREWIVGLRPEACPPSLVPGLVDLLRSVPVLSAGVVLRIDNEGRSRLAKPG